MKEEKATAGLQPLPAGHSSVRFGFLRIARVQREIQEIENENIADWQALPSPNVQGTRRSFQGSTTGPIQYLSKLLNYDFEHVAVQKQGVRLLPYALRRL